MKRNLASVLFCLMLVSSTSLAFTDLQIWMKRLAREHGPERKATWEEVISNPNLAKEILFYQHPVAWEDIAKCNAFVCLEISSYRGLISREEFFDVACKMLANIDLYHQPNGRELGLQRYRTGLANYGWNKKEGGLPELLGMFDTLLKILSAMQNNGLISNSGVKNSLAAKIESAKAAVEKHLANGKVPAINKIEAAKSEAEAQKWKKITAPGCGLFLRFCENLIWQINHTQF